MIAVRDTLLQDGAIVTVYNPKAGLREPMHFADTAQEQLIELMRLLCSPRGISSRLSI